MAESSAPLDVCTLYWNRKEFVADAQSGTSAKELARKYTISARTAAVRAFEVKTILNMISLPELTGFA